MTRRPVYAGDGGIGVAVASWLAGSLPAHRGGAVPPTIRPDLHAELVNRMVFGNKVIDHERVHGVGPVPQEVAAIYEVTPQGIAKVWFVSGD